MFGRIGFGRTSRWNACCTPASAALRDAFAFPTFAFGIAPATKSCDSGACQTADQTARQTDGTVTPTYRLPVDVAEERRDGGSVWVIVANVPGFKKDDIAIELKDGILSIEATRNRPAAAPASESTVYRRERRSVNLARQIQLPENAADDGVQAVLADGVLTVTVPQRPETQPRKITIG